MALQLGGMTRRELERRMGALELADWKAYFRVQAEDRGDEVAVREKARRAAEAKRAEG